MEIKAMAFSLWWGNVKNKAAKMGESIKKVGEEDPRRIIHSLKVGLALTLVSFFYYWRPFYYGFGTFGMWAVMTVVMIFEYTVGATLSKSLNRVLGTLLAGTLGVAVNYLSNFFGQKGEPIVLGIFVFLIASSATFSRFFPAIRARYDYGVLIFILTFSLVSISGYRVEELLMMANHRLSTILAGGAICVIVSIFICPVWAGETLHNLVASNIDKLANYLEGFHGEYFECYDDGEDVIVIDHKDKSFLQGYKIVLNSKSTEDSLANFARWEPGHGKFWFRHPWKQYLKIGSLTRQCACQIESLNGNLNSDVKRSLQFRNVIKESCTKMSSESGKALKELAKAIRTMSCPSSSNLHLDNAKSAIKDLKESLKSASAVQQFSSSSDLLTIIPEATVASILIEIVKSVESIFDSIIELSLQAHFKSVEAVVSETDTTSHVAITLGETENIDNKP